MKKTIQKDYKVVKLGPKEVDIPKDWNIVRLGDRTKINMGSSPPSKYYNSNEDGLPFFQGNADFGKLYPTANIWCSKPQKIAKRGEILISVRAPVGELNINFEKSCIGRGIASIDGLNEDSRFLFYILSRQKKILKTYSQGSTFDSINKSDLETFKIPLPPKNQQKKIAEILSTVDHTIAQTDEIIAKTQLIKKGLMKNLLTEGVGHSQFKKIKIGPKEQNIPETWKVYNLGDIAFVTKLAGFEYTNHFNSYKDGGEIIVIRGTNIRHNTLYLNEVKKIPKETSEELPRSQLKKGDLVFAYVGTIGPVYLIKESNKFHLGPNTAKISTDSNILLPEYAYQYFSSNLIKNEILKNTSISAQPSLSMSKIRKFKIILPDSIKEQEKIVSVLANMDEKIQKEKEYKQKLEELKKGLMQDLLTGKKRVKVENT